eukprot:gene2888-3590_t
MGFPWRKLSGPYLILFCDSLISNSISAYIGFMILWFQLTNDLTKIGYYSGYGLTAFNIAQIGRIPVLLICGVVSSVGLISMGFCSSFPLFIALRFLQGSFYCNLFVVKTYIGEITEPEYQVQAYEFTMVIP